MGLSVYDFLFYAFALLACVGGLLVVFVSNPIYSSLFLALVMTILGALFFMLDAPFLAAAQIIVYAGAVMVLFVMVMMLFDLKKDLDDVSRFSPITVMKVLACGVLCGILIGTGWLITSQPKRVQSQSVSSEQTNVVLKDPGSAPTEDLQNPEELKQEVVEITQNKNAGSEIFKDYSETQKLSLRLFSKFIFAFEILSVLLLVAIVGAVALARSKGGTHHVNRRS